MKWNVRYCRQAIVNLQIRHRFFLNTYKHIDNFVCWFVCLSVCMCVWAFSSYYCCLTSKFCVCDTQITIPRNFILSYHLKSKSNFAFISTNTISCHSKRFMMPHIHIVSELSCFCEKEIAYYMKPNVDCQLLIANASQSEDQQFYQIMNVN